MNKPMQNKPKVRKPMQKTNVEKFVDALDNNPDRIIAWAKREIAEYQKLIDILEEQKLQKTISTNR